MLHSSLFHVCYCSRNVHISSHLILRKLGFPVLLLGDASDAKGKNAEAAVTVRAQDRLSRKLRYLKSVALLQHFLCNDNRSSTTSLITNAVDSLSTAASKEMLRDLYGHQQELKQYCCGLREYVREKNMNSGMSSEHQFLIKQRGQVLNSLNQHARLRHIPLIYNIIISCIVLHERCYTNKDYYYYL